MISNLFNSVKSIIVKEKEKVMEKDKVMPKIKVPTIYGAGKGALGVFTTPSNVYWYTCRDQFHAATEKRHEGFFFSCQAGTKKNVIEFMKRVEQSANVTQENSLQIQETDQKDVLWIVLNDWWNYRVRRSLLTAFLRAGQDFKEDTGKGFTDAINASPYFSTTKPAVERFLEGATSLKIKKGHFSGWQDKFYNKNAEQVKAMLVKLKKNKVENQVEVENQETVEEGVK